jgi:hypothetical protein
MASNVSISNLSSTEVHQLLPNKLQLLSKYSKTPKLLHSPLRYFNFKKFSLAIQDLQKLSLAIKAIGAVSQILFNHIILFIKRFSFNILSSEPY